jgi:ABC-2 type transport system ATP-binding protein
MIHVANLRKSYDGTEVVRGVSFEVGPGEVFCLLGPNGAGKTTTVEILEGYRLPGEGQVTVLGRDPSAGGREFRERVGIVLQESVMTPTLKVGELLEMHARYHRHPRPIDEVMALVELDARRGDLIEKLSGGQRRRLDLALALVGDPDLLFLDEPTTGFDPGARRHAWAAIRSLCSLGKTVVLTTHYMDEAQALADRVGVMVEGELVACGPPSQLAGRDELPTEIRFARPPLPLPELGDAVVTIDGDNVLITTQSGLETAHELTGWALENGVTLRGFEVAQPSLEDVYLALTA